MGPQTQTNVASAECLCLGRGATASAFNAAGVLRRKQVATKTQADHKKELATQLTLSCIFYDIKKAASNADGFLSINKE